MSEEMSSESTSEAEISDSTEAISEGESAGYEGSEEATEGSVEEHSEASEEVTEEYSEPEQPKTYTALVNGREEQVTIEEMRSNYQQRSASAETFRKASEERKAAEELLATMQRDPVAALRNSGMSEEEIQDYFYSQTKTFLDLSEETDDQRETRLMKEENAAYRQEKEDRENGLRTQNERVEAEAQEASIESEFTAALEAGEVPSSPGAISRIAQIQLLNLDKGYDISVSEAAQIYREERQQDVNTMFDGMNIDQVMSWLGNDRMKAIRSKDLDKVRRGTPVAKQEQASAPKVKSERRSAKDFFS